MAEVRLHFVSANPAPTVESIDPLPGIVNYMLGNDPAQWQTNVPTYASLRYKQLYPGIDLRYDGVGGRLKGTYLVAAGADPTRIRWQYEGTTAITVDSNGNLVATLAAKRGQTAPTLVEQAPIAWQTINGRQVPVDVRYQIESDNTIGFVVGSYDRALPLVLDPILDYSSYVGTTGNDIGYSITVDGAGAAYITGETSSINGDKDAFVTKLDPDGKTALYTTYIGGSSIDLGNDIVADTLGNVYLVGNTRSSNFPQANPSNSPLKGEQDAFITTLGITGTLAYSTYLGGDSHEEGNSIALHNGQDLYVTGLTESRNFSASSTLVGASDVFVTKVRMSDKTIVYSTLVGGKSSDVGKAIAIDNIGNAYITGFTYSTDYPTPGGPYPRPNGDKDAFLTKLDISGRNVYSTYLGGAEKDEGNGVAVDSNNNVYVVGSTLSANFPISSSSYQKKLNRNGGGGTSDAFITKFITSGGISYTTYLGGTSSDSGEDLVVDPQKGVYLIGTTYSNDFVNDTDTAIQSTRNGEADVFITHLNPTGTRLEYSSYFGGTALDFGHGIALRCVADECTTYITGQTLSQDFPTTGGSSQPNYSGNGWDSFVVRLGPVPSGPRLFLEPPLRFIGRDQIFSVDLKVNTNGTNIDTVDAYLKFDPAYLKVVNSQGDGITEVEPDTGIAGFVTYNKVDNDKGTIDFSATKGVHGSGGDRTLPPTFTAAKIFFQTRKITAGGPPATISLVSEKARRSDLYWSGDTRGAKLGNANIRILDGTILNGKISLEKRSVPGSSSWITELLRYNGPIPDNGITIYERNTSPPKEVGSVGTTTDNQGRFSVFIESIYGDQYDIQVKGSNTLSNIRPADLRFPDTVVDFGTLCVGDSTGDDMINGADISYMVPSYDKQAGAIEFRRHGDATKDSWVNKDDVSAVRENFLKTGAMTEDTASPPACKYLATRSTLVTEHLHPAPVALADPASTPMQIEPASIKLSPSTIQVMPRRTFTTSLQVDLRSNKADTIDVFLTVEPSEFEFVDTTGAAANEVEVDLAGLANSSCSLNYNKIERKTNHPTQANFSVTCLGLGGQFLPNTFTLATLRLKPIIVKNSAQITLLTEDEQVRDTNLYHEGEALPLASTSGGATVEVRTLYTYIPLTLR
jgi:hypothetical protein